MKKKNIVIVTLASFLFIQTLVQSNDLFQAYLNRTNAIVAAAGVGFLAAYLKIYYPLYRRRQEIQAFLRHINQQQNKNKNYQHSYSDTALYGINKAYVDLFYNPTKQPETITITVTVGSLKGKATILYTNASVDVIEQKIKAIWRRLLSIKIRQPARSYQPVSQGG